MLMEEDHSRVWLQRTALEEFECAASISSLNCILDLLGCVALRGVWI
jgi:hypothetical protein